MGKGAKNSKGFFVVIEGIDHTGKETQSKLLEKRFEKLGLRTFYFDFPQYKKRSSVFIRDYLAGEFGDATKLDPWLSNLFFALDRFSAKPQIVEALERGGGGFQPIHFFRPCPPSG